MKIKFKIKMITSEVLNGINFMNKEKIMKSKLTKRECNQKVIAMNLKIKKIKMIQIMKMRILTNKIILSRPRLTLEYLLDTI